MCYGLDYRSSMIFYRGDNNCEWEGELHSIIKQAEQSDIENKASFLGYMRVLLSPAFLRPFRCVGILHMLQNMAGIVVINSYTATFLEVPVNQDNLLFCLLGMNKCYFPGSLHQTRQENQYPLKNKL